MPDLPQEEESNSSEQRKLLSARKAILFSEMAALIVTFIFILTLFYLIDQSIGFLNPHKILLLNNSINKTLCVVLYIWAIAGFLSIICSGILGYIKGRKEIDKIDGNE